MRILSATSVGEINREVVVAYSTLAIFEHHFGPVIGCEIPRLLSQFAYVREVEGSRVLRQRRIALTKILAETVALR